MRHLKTNQVIRNIAADHKVSTKDANDVIITVFEFIKHVMSNEADRDALHFPTVRIPNFAIFYVPDSTKQRYSEQLKNKDNNESDRI